MRNNAFDGISLDNNSNDNEIIDNFTGDNHDDGIDLEDSTGNLFDGNVVGEFETIIFDLFIDASGNDEEGFNLDRADGNTFKNNVMRGNNHGFDIEDSDNNIFEDNDASFNDNDLIKIKNSNGNTFTRNTANGSDEDDGFDLEGAVGNIFKDNIANDNDGEGFEVGLTEGTGGSHENIFTGNTATNNGSGESGEGVKLNFSNDNTFTGNTFDDNISDGVEIRDSLRNVFSGNSITSNGNDGIDMDRSNDNTFSCNTINDNGAQPSGVGQGVKMEESSTRNEVFLNEINRNPVGIGLSSGAFDNTFVDNNIIDNENQLVGFGAGDNILNPNFWGGDVPSGLDDEPHDSPVDLSECGIEPEPEPEPEPITEISCSYDDETSVVLNGVLDYSVGGTCDITRGDSVETKDVTIDVSKEILGEINPDFNGLGGSGILYTVFSPTNTLQSIDTDTLGVTDIGPLGVAEIFGGLAYDPNSDTLYLVDGRGSKALYEVNRTTGEATLIGNHGITDMFGLAFDSKNNVLYAGQFSGGTGFYSMNVNNGQATFIGDVSLGNGLGGLAYDSLNDRLIGMNAGAGDLYEVDRSDAQLTLPP